MNVTRLLPLSNGRPIQQKLSVAYVRRGTYRVKKPGTIANMPKRVVDASVAVKWVMKGESHRRQARKLLRESIASRIKLIAPPLFESETGVTMGRSITSSKLGWVIPLCWTHACTARELNLRG